MSAYDDEISFFNVQFVYLMPGRPNLRLRIIYVPFYHEGTV